MELQKALDDLTDKSNKRFDDFEIEKIGDLSKIQDDAYLEKSMWQGGDEKFVCIGVDLDSSSKYSAKKNVSTMARLYEYFTQNIVDVFSNDSFKADYIDIKGDGVFGIFEGDKAIERAFVAGVTFKTFFEDVIAPKFKSEYKIDLICKLSITKDKVLVKKIGNRKYKNEVWAGRLVNNAYKIMNQSSKIKEATGKYANSSLIILSSEIFELLEKNYKDYAIMSCGCGSENNEPVELWGKHSTMKDDEVVDNVVYYNSSRWCNLHGEDFLNNII